MNLLLTLLQGFLCCSLAGGAEGLQQFDLKSTEMAGATVYYESCFEQKLPAFENMYRKHLNTIQANQFDQLVEKQGVILDDLNRIIGGDAALRQVQEQGLSHFIQAMSSFSSGGRTFYLMLQGTIKDYLRKGGRLPNFSYDKETDTAEYLARFESTIDGNPQDLEMTFPLPSIEQFESAVEQIFKIFQDIRKTFAYPVAIHEITEISIYEQLESPAPHIRWFTDGMANAIAAELLAKHFSREAAEQFTADYTTEPYQDVEKMILLQYWMQVKYWNSNRIPLPSEKKLNHARYCYATHEAKRLIDTHGIECVGKIIQAFQNRNEKSTEDLYAAIQQVTGEDLRQRFLKYQLFETQQQGQLLYLERFQKAQEEKDTPAMTAALLRTLELADNPLTMEALLTRKVIAQLLFELGHVETADQIMHETVDLCSSLGLDETAYQGRELFIMYAIELYRPEIAADYAAEILEKKPKALPALTIQMLIAHKKGQKEKARKLARNIQALAEDGPYIQIAEQISQEGD